MIADDLRLIADAALAAGELALALREQGLATASKRDGTPVTNADLEVDALLKAWLTEARPEYGWLSEETADDPARLAHQRLFVVDPIDGTRDYLRGRPWWSISIAVVHGHRPIAGVVHAPQSGETYLATAGGGAARNGAAIAPGTTNRLKDCAMLADQTMMTDPRWPQPWPPMRCASRNSTAYRVCLVAAGDFDATLAMSFKAEWDLAAADLIATEAGCLVTTHTGAPLAYNQINPKSATLVCAGPALHPLILERVRTIELASSSELY